MTVQELIAHLEQFDPNMPVHFAYNYGDHWRTMVAPAVQSVEELRIEYSGYHEQFRLVEDEEEEDEESNEEEKSVVVLT